jgi:hypothetical protein
MVGDVLSGFTRQAQHVERRGRGGAGHGADRNLYPG